MQNLPPVTSNTGRFGRQCKPIFLWIGLICCYPNNMDTCSQNEWGKPVMCSAGVLLAVSHSTQ